MALTTSCLSPCCSCWCWPQTLPLLLLLTKLSMRVQPSIIISAAQAVGTVFIVFRSCHICLGNHAAAMGVRGAISSELPPRLVNARAQQGTSSPPRAKRASCMLHCSPRLTSRVLCCSCAWRHGRAHRCGGGGGTQAGLLRRAMHTGRTTRTRHAKNRTVLNPLSSEAGKGQRACPAASDARASTSACRSLFFISLGWGIPV